MPSLPILAIHPSLLPAIADGGRWQNKNSLVNHTLPPLFRISIVIVFSISIIGCSTPRPHATTAHDWSNDPFIAAISQYGTADPVQDCRRAKRSGDRRFLAVRGYATELPGLDTSRDAVLIRRHGFRIIEGTSDAITKPEHKLLNAIARHYATGYNLYLRENL